MSLLSAPEIRARVAGAARTVTPTWPLTSFIAVNPVAGYESRPMSELATALGEMPTRPERDYLRSYEAGEISAAALQAALRQLLPELAGMGELTAAGRSVSAVAVAMAGLQQPPSDATASGGGSGDDAGERRRLANLEGHARRIHRPRTGRELRDHQVGARITGDRHAGAQVGRRHGQPLERREIALRGLEAAHARRRDDGGIALLRGLGGVVGTRGEHADECARQGQALPLHCARTG